MSSSCTLITSAEQYIREALGCVDIVSHRNMNVAKLGPLESQKFLLRVIWGGGTEVLRAVLPLSDGSYATCGSRLLQMGNTERLNSGCAVQVLKMLRGAKTSNGVGGRYIPGQLACLVCGAERCWSARPRCHRCAQSRGSLPQAHGGGPPAHVPALVPGRVPLFQANRGNAPAPASPVVPGLVFGPLGKALPSKGSRVPPAGRLPGFGAHSPGTVTLSRPPPGAGVGFRDSSPGAPRSE